MLDPHKRSLYTAALIPPINMVFDEAIGTSFSMDPSVLLTVPIYLSMLSGKKDDQINDQIALLKSIRHLSDKITFYNQSGETKIPEHKSILYGLLEKMIVNVESPEKNGVFHPKLWLMRFLNPIDKSVMIRLLVLSRNLTKDRSWDLALTLEGRPTSEKLSYNMELSELILQLPELSRAKIDSERVDQAKRLASEVRQVEWQLPSGFDEINFHALGISQDYWAESLAPSDRIAVMSPFCTDEVLKKFVDKTSQPIALISRPEMFAELNEKTTQEFGRNLILADEVETEDGEELDIQENIDTHGLHAKAYIFERDQNTHLVLGSANATNAAMLSTINIEILVELEGKHNQIGGIDDLLGKNGMGEVLIDYCNPEKSVKDAEQKKAESALKSAVNTIVASELVIKCTQIQDSEKWQVDIVGTVAPLKDIKKFNAWMITLSEKARAVSLFKLQESNSLRLGEFDPSYITGLLGIELQTKFRSDLGPIKKRFTLNLPLKGLPLGVRETAILQSIITNSAGFLRYLQLLLCDIDGNNSQMNLGIEGMDFGKLGLSDFDSSQLLEELIRAFSRDPDRLLEVADVVNRLIRSDSSQKIFTAKERDKFLSTWDAFECVMENRND